MYRYKSRSAHSFKSATSLADCHQFKIMHQLYNKKLFYCTFVPLFAFFLFDFSRANIKKNQILLCQSSNPFLNSFPLEKLIDLIAKFHIRKLKIEFSIFDWIKEKSAYSFWICQNELRVSNVISAHYLQLFTMFLFAWKWKKVLRLYHWYHPTHHLILDCFSLPLQSWLHFSNALFI